MKRDYTRPLRMVHNMFNYEPGDTYEIKCRKIRNRLQFLKDFGYGGIVTNVQEGPDYLNDKEELELMTEKAKICKELGLRMWIYDEDKYPSGAARTKTVDANMDFQALGLAMVWNVVAPGKTLTQSLPQGHIKLIAAVSYKIEADTPTDEELLTPYARYQGEPVEFVNDTDKNLLCLAFYSKPAYVNTHATNNSCYHRLYVDVSNPDAIAEFVNNTYRPYTEVLKDYFSPAFGDEGENSVVEAIFTDEPSYMGVYINSYHEQKLTLHPVDLTMPLYMMVNWGLYVSNRFRSTYGYSLEDELTALFLGHSEHFRRVRHDYYQLMSDLYEKAFYAQLSDYCSSVGLQFSGHILLEDRITYHVIFEGNFFNLLRHMHIPGIDMLTSIPEEGWNMAFTPKLVRSISDLYGRGHVMNEISAFNQGASLTKLGNVTYDQIYTSVMLQLAFGTDILHSYYPEVDPDDAQDQIWSAVTRATEAIIGPRVSDTLLFYPIETMMRHRKPMYHKIEKRYEPILREQDDSSWDYMSACENAMLGAQFAMINGQHNFTYIDSSTARHQADGVWKNLVVGACDLTDEVLVAISHLIAGGTQLIWYAPEGTEMFDCEFAKLPSGVKRATTEEELIAILCPNGTILSGDHAGIAMAESSENVLLVNKDDREKKVCWHGEFTSLIDAYDGNEVATEKCDCGVCFTIAKSAAYILKK
ncbi:MAG: hypothetical protein IKB38_06700 [Clostridia bacterium]|nr:hypothetical protein [Clostridia bacterium]